MNNDLKEIKMLLALQAKTTLGVDDVALMLGVSKQTVYRLVSSGRITHYKSKGMNGEMGKMVYFRREDVEDYCFAVKKASEAEIDTMVKRLRR